MEAIEKSGYQSPAEMKKFNKKFKEENGSEEQWPHASDWIRGFNERLKLDRTSLWVDESISEQYQRVVEEYIKMKHKEAGEWVTAEQYNGLVDELDKEREELDRLKKIVVEKNKEIVELARSAIKVRELCEEQMKQALQAKEKEHDGLVSEMFKQAKKDWENEDPGSLY